MPRPDDEYDDRDDRPRRRFDEDDEDDDRPRRRKSSGTTTLIIVLAVGAGVLALCCPLSIALLLPAVSKVRQAAARAQTTNNMKQQGLAFHNQNDTYGQLRLHPVGPDGGKANPGLAVRVGLLPFVEQESVYRQFNWNEPWDGPTNRRLADQETKPFHTPFDPPGTTTSPFRVFVGGGALFDEDGRKVSIQAIPDGSSNTILLAMAEEQVKWSEPKELAYSPAGPLPKLGHPQLSGGSLVLMGDGRVVFLRATTAEPVYRALVTRAGGEQLPPGWDD